MASNGFRSRGERFGSGFARAVKRLIAIERRLIARAGKHKNWARVGLITTKLAIAAALAALTTWALLLVIPFIVVVWVWAHLADSGRMFIRDDTTL